VKKAAETNNYPCYGEKYRISTHKQEL